MADDQAAVTDRSNRMSFYVCSWARITILKDHPQTTGVEGTYSHLRLTSQPHSLSTWHGEWYNAGNILFFLEFYRTEERVTITFGIHTTGRTRELPWPNHLFLSRGKGGLNYIGSDEPRMLCYKYFILSHEVERRISSTITQWIIQLLSGRYQSVCRGLSNIQQSSNETQN